MRKSLKTVGITKLTIPSHNVSQVFKPGAGGYVDKPMPNKEEEDDKPLTKDEQATAKRLSSR